MAWTSAVLAALLIGVGAGPASAKRAPPPPRGPDGFTRYAGVALRERLEARSDFRRAWARDDEHDRDNTSVLYVHKVRHPDFFGVPVAKVALTVSRRHQVVIGFGLFVVSDERCARLRTELDAAWGTADAIGGAKHEVEWLGRRIDASLEDSPGGCALFLGDRGWDDERDAPVTR